jgi:2-methylisocitrate lyase-like PEP mutase family enzyme
MATLGEKSATLRALLARPGSFVSAHPWDVGTARVLTSLGFEALATASSGLAFALGRKDAENGVSRDEMLAWAGGIAAATHLPVTADLENGFGDTPEDCARTMREASAAGLCGGSIEDATGEGHALYDIAHATQRIKAAADAAHALPVPFIVIARADGFLHGHRDVNDAITRAQAYADAGADVIFVPGLPDIESIRRVCAAVNKPVTVLVGRGNQYNVKDLTAAGAKEIGLGSTLFRTAWGTLFSAAKEVQEKGTFTFEAASVPYETLNGMMVGKKG